MRRANEEGVEELRRLLECEPCPICGAVLIKGMPKFLCCGGEKYGAHVKSSLPPEMDPEILQRIEAGVRRNANFARRLNRDLRPVLQYAQIRSPNAASSNLHIHGVPYALDHWNQFKTVVYAVFQRPIVGGNIDAQDIADIIAMILARNQTLRAYLRERLDSLKRVATVSMDEPDDGMVLAIFNADSPQLEPHQIEAIKSSYETHKLSQMDGLYDLLLYPGIFWSGTGGCGIESGADTNPIRDLILYDTERETSNRGRQQEA
jgi:hypothetical protein